MQAPDSLESAAASTRAQRARLDAIATDLANAATPGYIAETPASPFSHSLSVAQGALRRTGVPTDLALSGSGFFSTAVPDGVRYSRDGRLSALDGTLRDIKGNALLGALGPVRFPRGATIDSDGRIIAGGRVIDRLRIVDLGAHAKREADGYCSATNAVTKRSAAAVRSGYLEDSGVDAISEMTALVTSQRAFEADQKAAQLADETLRRAVTDVAAVRA